MGKTNITQQVISGSFWNFITSLIGRSGGLIFTIILARVLLPEKFGIYSLAISVALIFIAFTDLGINQTMIRYVSAEISKNKKKATAYFLYLFKIKVILSLVTTALLLILAYPLSMYIFKKPSLFPLFLILGIYTLILPLSGFFESFLYVRKKVNYLAVKEAIFQIGKILLVIPIFIFLSIKYHILGVISSLIIINLFVLLVLIYYTGKFSPFIFKKVKQDFDKKRILKFLAFISIASLSAIFYSYIDILMLGVFVDELYIGLYRAAVALVFGIIGLLSFYNVLLPAFMEVKKERLEQAFNKVLTYISILAIPAVFGLLVLGRYIIKFIYGESYLSSSLFLYILTPLIFLEIISALLASLFSVKEAPKYVTKVMVISTILNIILNYILITSLLNISQLWATAGAAMATTISRVFYFFGLLILTKKVTKVKTDFTPMLKPLMASLVMSVSIISLGMLISDLTILSGILEFLVGVIIYFAILFLIKGVTKKEISNLFLIKNSLGFH